MIPVAQPVASHVPQVPALIVDTRKIAGYQQVRVILTDGSVMTIPIGSNKVYVMRPDGGWGELTLQPRKKEDSHASSNQPSSLRRANYAGP